MIIEMMANRIGWENSVKEVRDEWLEELLMFIGIDINEVKEIGLAEFTRNLIKDDIEIIEYPSIGALSVSVDGEVVGEWAGPKLTLKEDKERGGFYYKIEIEVWSIIEEDIDLSS